MVHIRLWNLNLLYFNGKLRRKTNKMITDFMIIDANIALSCPPKIPLSRV